jgi:hypothetical protein
MLALSSDDVALYVMVFNVSIAMLQISLMLALLVHDVAAQSALGHELE